MIYIKMKEKHRVVGAIITADPWWPCRMFLVKRKDEGEKYWPGIWCYLTEHIEPGETDVEAIYRGMKEETGLEPKIIFDGPAIDNIVDPIYKESFEVRLYQVIPNHWAPRLNEENTRFTWTTGDLSNNASLLNEPIFPHLEDHIQMVKDYRLWGDMKPAVGWD